MLTGIELLPAGAATAVVSFGLLALHSRGFRRFEFTIAAFVAVIAVAFCAQARYD